MSVCSGCLAQASRYATPRSAQWKWTSWLTKSYHPFDDAVVGIPVQTIKPGWTAIEVISRKTFSPEELSEVYERDDFKPTWEIKRYLNGDGQIERVLVGVATSSNDELHRFLLILTQAPGGASSKPVVKVSVTSTCNRPKHGIRLFPGPSLASGDRRRLLRKGWALPNVVRSHNALGHSVVNGSLASVFRW